MMLVECIKVALSLFIVWLGTTMEEHGDNGQPLFCHETYRRRTPEELHQIFTELAERSITYLLGNEDRTHTPVIEFLTPKELLEVFDLELAKGTDGDGFHGIWQHIEKCMKYSVRTGHPRFLNQLWAGTDVASMIGEIITTVTNASTYTYEVAPVYSLMELEVIRKMRSMVGWEEPGDGVLCPGGAYSNFYGMLMARQKAVPDVRKKGNGTVSLTAYTSKHAHYTIKRGTFLMGMGMDAVRYVEVDSEGRMIPEALERAIQTDKKNGCLPFFVNATSQTTVLGAFDPLHPIADICAKHDIWLHCDAAWGGGVLASPTYCRLMDGVERCDSVCWCLHKMIGLQQQASAVLVHPRHGSNVLKNCNASNADYLFHAPEDHDETPYDLGDKTLNCGRRQDAFKCWLSWKVHGDLGYKARVERAFENRDYFLKQLRRHPDAFWLLWQPQGLNTCFWYIPPRLRTMDREDRDLWKKLGVATAQIRRKMQLRGKCLVNFNPLDEKPNFFRLVISNPDVRYEDMDFLIQEIEECGKDL